MKATGPFAGGTEGRVEITEAWEGTTDRPVDTRHSRVNGTLGCVKDSEAAMQNSAFVDGALYRSYTKTMKTAVSLPDKLYTEAEKTAREMGLPRSQLFAKALEEFIERHNRERITEQLDRVYGAAPRGDLGEGVDSGLEALRELTRDDAW